MRNLIPHDTFIPQEPGWYQGRARDTQRWECFYFAGQPIKHSWGGAQEIELTAREYAILCYDAIRGPIPEPPAPLIDRLAAPAVPAATPAPAPAPAPAQAEASTPTVEKKSEAAPIIERALDLYISANHLEISGAERDVLRTLLEGFVDLQHHAIISVLNDVTREDKAAIWHLITQRVTITKAALDVPHVCGELRGVSWERAGTITALGLLNSALIAGAILPVAACWVDESRSCDSFRGFGVHKPTAVS